MKPVLEFFKRITAGYGKIGKVVAMAALFLLALFLFNYLAILPLRTLAVNYRLVYNCLAIGLLAVFCTSSLVKLVKRTGIKKLLSVAGLALLLVALFLMPLSLNIFSLALSLVYLLLLLIIKLKKLVQQAIVTFLILLCYLNSLYRIAFLWSRGSLWIALPMLVCYLLFLGYLTYEKRIQRKDKFFS